MKDLSPYNSIVCNENELHVTPVESYIAAEEEKPKKNTPSLFPIVCAVILCTVSLIVHASAIISIYSHVAKEGASLFFSRLIPEYVSSDPTTPPLQEGDSLSRPAVESETPTSPFKTITQDLSAKFENGMAITNETSYNPDLYHLLYEDRIQPSLSTLNKKYKKSSPKVLIYHTHATEGFADTEGTGFRSTDDRRNTVAIGKVICAVLKEANIGVIHLTEQFDSDDWSLAYDNSNAAVTKVLKKYPSIQYVFDIHRDCVGNSEDGYVRAVTKINKQSTAQLMFVCGTDDGGSGHTSWRQNLSFALKLQSLIWNKHESMMRPINLRKASFYQNTSPSSLIVECGTCVCSIEEAKRAGVIFASALADYITENEYAVDEKALMEALCP